MENITACVCRREKSLSTLYASEVLLIALVTILVSACFVITKTAYDEVRKLTSTVTLLIIGAGPIGLLSLYVAARCRCVSHIILYEEKTKANLLDNNNQIALDRKSVEFLKTFGIDFDDIDGCWHDAIFYTKTGVFLHYLISNINQLDVSLDLRLNTKFTKESLKELELIFSRLVAILCEGATDRASSLLGLSDEFLSHPCHFYGAVALLERPDLSSVPAPEIRVHHVSIRMNDICHRVGRVSVGQGFHMKIFGTLRHRRMAMIVPRRQSKMINMLKVVHDHSVMRNVFLACYNKYKSDSENVNSQTDSSIKWLKCSPRLFEIKLSVRMENVAYVEDADIFVITEGDAARRLNFHTGLVINLGIKGLMSLTKFLQMAASADTEQTILQTLKYKHNHSRILTQDYLRTDLKHSMYT